MRSMDGKRVVKVWLKGVQSVVKWCSKCGQRVFKVWLKSGQREDEGW